VAVSGARIRHASVGFDAAHARDGGKRRRSPAAVATTVAGCRRLQPSCSRARRNVDLPLPWAGDHVPLLPRALQRRLEAHCEYAETAGRPNADAPRPPGPCGGCGRPWGTPR